MFVLVSFPIFCLRCHWVLMDILGIWECHSRLPAGERKQEANCNSQQPIHVFFLCRGVFCPEPVKSAKLPCVAQPQHQYRMSPHDLHNTLQNIPAGATRAISLLPRVNSAVKPSTGPYLVLSIVAVGILAHDPFQMPPKMPSCHEPEVLKVVLNWQCHSPE